MPLSAVEIRNAKPKDKPYCLSNENGMHLEVRPNGARYWRLAYRYQGKQKLLALSRREPCTGPWPPGGGP